MYYTTTEHIILRLLKIFDTFLQFPKYTRRNFFYIVEFVNLQLRLFQNRGGSGTWKPLPLSHG